MAADAMDVDEPLSSGTIAPSLNLGRISGPSTSLVSDVIATYRPTKLFPKDDKTQSYVLSLDFDDPGDLCISSESDDTIQIYNVKDGRLDKSLASKKYGAKLAKFTHNSSSIIYASTKQNNAIRYLATQDNSFIRYFEGHEDNVTSLALHPGSDNFISCSQDSTVLMWNISNKQWIAKLFLNDPRLAAWDPSGNVFAIGCPASGMVLLYDYRNVTKAPFTTIDLLPARNPADPIVASFCGWTQLAFSNDGKHILVGSKFGGHYLLDAFNGSLKAYLKKPGSGTSRSGVGENEGPESSGDCCFSPDGRYVISGAQKDLLIWDTLGTPSETYKELEPLHILEEKREAGVVAFNPRYNMVATADREVMFWLPDPHC
ncbi:WD repeat-containing protein 82 [Thozetella sp. PMI_491]|nr:WD repeat-containing protein 82 [Thozetella sp. PMI_491]